MNETDIIDVEPAGPPSLAQNWKAHLSDSLAVADSLAAVINDRGLFQTIGDKKHILIGGWQLVGAAAGITAYEHDVAFDTERQEWRAEVLLKRNVDGAVVGRGSAILSVHERVGRKRTWNDSPAYAQRSMCITRAAGKAFRLAFGYLIDLAGFASTPAEEMEAALAPVARPPAKPAPPPPDRGATLLATLDQAIAAGDYDRIRKGVGVIIDAHAAREISEPQRDALLTKAQHAIDTIEKEFAQQTEAHGGFGE